jgi:hypothetical protein
MRALRTFGMGNERQDWKACKGAKVSGLSIDDVPFNPERFPRCTAYLKGMGCRFTDSAWNNYWAAVLLADTFNDKELLAVGVDYNLLNGSELLRRLESLFSGPRSRVACYGSKAKREMDSRAPELVAYLGSRGVKTSALKSDDDFVKAARILWPFMDKAIRYDQLLGQIMSMSKKTRRTANANLGKLPPDWRGAK